MRGRPLLGRRFAGRAQLCRYKPGVARDGFAREPDLELHGWTFHRAERHRLRQERLSARYRCRAMILF